MAGVSGDQPAAREVSYPQAPGMSHLTSMKKMLLSPWRLKDFTAVCQEMGTKTKYLFTFMPQLYTCDFIYSVLQKAKLERTEIKSVGGERTAKSRMIYFSF